MFSYQKAEYGVFERIGARQNKVRLEKQKSYKTWRVKGDFRKEMLTEVMLFLFHALDNETSKET